MKISKASLMLKGFVTPVPAEHDQADVAKALGVTRQAVWAWITGEAQPTTERMAKIEDLLGIPMRAWAEQAEPDTTDTTGA